MQPVLVIQYSSVDEGDNYKGSRSESTYCRKASSCVEKFDSQILSASFMFYVGNIQQEQSMHYTSWKKQI